MSYRAVSENPINLLMNDSVAATKRTETFTTLTVSVSRGERTRMSIASVSRKIHIKLLPTLKKLRYIRYEPPPRNDGHGSPIEKLETSTPFHLSSPTTPNGTGIWPGEPRDHTRVVDVHNLR